MNPFSQSIMRLTSAAGTAEIQRSCPLTAENTVCSGNKDQIIICSVYRKTAAISSQIMILTILGGQTIFIACLLRLIFLSCLTQLEVEGGERERQRSRKTDESRMNRGGERVCVVSQHDTVFFMCLCMCVFVLGVCVRTQSKQRRLQMRPAGPQTDARAPGATGNPKNWDKESRRSPFAHHRCTFAFTMCFLFSAILLTSVAVFNFNGLLVLQTSCLLSHIKRSMAGFISRAGQIIELHTIT